MLAVQASTSDGCFNMRQQPSEGEECYQAYHQASTFSRAVFQQAVLLSGRLLVFRVRTSLVGSPLHGVLGSIKASPVLWL